MKTYFRLLSFAKPIEKFAIPYVIFTIFSVIFSDTDLALLAPLLQTLFLGKHVDTAAVLVKPKSLFDMMGAYNYYVPHIIQHYGAFKALAFGCGAIVVSALLANFFENLSQSQPWKIYGYTHC